MSHFRIAPACAFATLLCLALFHPCTHADSENFELLYSLGGECTDVVMEGQLAYVVGGGHLKILDVSTPSAPQILSTRSTTGNRVAQLTVVDGRAYVLVGSDFYKILGPVKLDIFDVANAAAPTLLASHDLSNNTPGGLAVSGDYAYTTVSFSGLLGGVKGVAQGGDLKILDISEPTIHNEVGGWQFTDDTPFRLDVVGSLAYICCGCTGCLRIFDVADPAGPTPVNSFYAGGLLTGIDFVGDVAYLSWAIPVTNSGGIEVVDAANPLAPAVLGRGDLGCTPMNVVVQNGIAFMPTLNSGLRVADVGVPEAITPAGYYETSGYCLGVAVAGEVVCLASEDGLFILRYTGAGSGEILEQPQGGWFEVGEPLELCVGVSGMLGAPTYQWFKDGEAIPGATDPCYEIDALALADDGWYRCRILETAKAVYESDPVHIEVFAAGSLPAAGGCGLALLVAVCGFAGVHALGRKRGTDQS